MSLITLILKCKRQDRQAQEMLYNKYSPKFFTLCLKYSSCYEQAKDNLQDGFIKIFQNINQYKGKGSFEGWMTRIIINTCLKEYQNKSIFLTIEEDFIAETEVEIDDDIISMKDLQVYIEELPDRYKLVFSLYAMEGFSHKEISKMLNISEGTSKSNLARARLKLKDKIEGHTYNIMTPEL